MHQFPTNGEPIVLVIRIAFIGGYFKSLSHLRIDHNFTDGTTEQDLKTIQNITAQNAFTADKIRLQSAWIILPVNPGPDQERECCRGTARNSADEGLRSRRGRQVKKLTIRPRQDGGIRSRIGNNPI